MNAWNDSAKTFTCTHSIKIFETMIIGLILIGQLSPRGFQKFLKYQQMMLKCSQN